METAIEPEVDIDGSERSVSVVWLVLAGFVLAAVAVVAFAPSPGPTEQERCNQEIGFLWNELLGKCESLVYFN